MPEAVIVAASRSPIGRAFKGSLTGIRPDDLTAQMIRAALAQVPQLDPGTVEDLMLGCGLPGGEQGFDRACVVGLRHRDQLDGGGIAARDLGGRGDRRAHRRQPS